MCSSFVHSNYRSYRAHYKLERVHGLVRVYFLQQCVILRAPVGLPILIFHDMNRKPPQTTAGYSVQQNKHSGPQTFRPSPGDESSRFLSIILLYRHSGRQEVVSVFNTPPPPSPLSQETCFEVRTQSGLFTWLMSLL